MEMSEAQFNYHQALDELSQDVYDAQNQSEPDEWRELARRDLIRIRKSLRFAEKILEGACNE